MTDWSGQDRRLSDVRFDKLNGDIEDIKSDVKKIYGKLFGNGDEGLDKQVDRNTRFRESMERKSGAWNSLYPAIVGGVMVGIIMYFINLL